uniref:Reverse transcriptase domain-containing protein n=1 Tax=Pseudonaja textilis TaxID=8673 RepID=A0A670ZAD8_PSETE
QYKKKMLWHNVENVIRQLKPSLFIGPDGLCLSTAIAEPLSIIFEKSFRTSSLPKLWSQATVIPIFKKGDPSLVENYRPISLCCGTCKAIDSIINQSIILHLETNNLLSNKQFGFRKKLSCNLQLLHCKNIWTTQLDQGKAIDAIYIDFCKVFDSVVHDKLLLKLKSYGISGQLHNWIETFLSHRQQMVKIGNKIEVSLRRSKQNYFEHANKPGRWLSYKLKKEKEKRLIHQLIDEKGIPQHEIEKKKDIILNYFQRLYKKEEINEDKIRTYLENTNDKTIGEGDKELLNKDITWSELKSAMENQCNNKSPGPDGIPVELYKATIDLVGPLMLEVFNEVLLAAKMPDSWREALIALIPKEDVDARYINNYRPISLLNADYKLFTSIIANRVKQVLNLYIHEDQNGFLPFRQIKNNLRTVIDVLEYYEAHPEKQFTLMFLDAEKAFDNLHWHFLIQKIYNMNLGTKFENIITTIYNTQQANILINGEQTGPLSIEKGVRQGCPLSPLLFIFALESLLTRIRQNSEIQGVRVKAEEYKLQAFADDMVFFLEDPMEKGHNLIKELEQYGSVAGLKINRNKTKLLTKNLTENQRKELEKTMGIQATKKVKYLGIWLTPHSKSLKENNYDKLLQQIKKDLESWNKLQLSLLGRIATIKMNILPKLLYLFQTIPIKLPKNFFDDINKVTLKFIWQGKKARISIKALQDAKSRGGLALPNWELYYWAANLLWLKDWVNLRNKRTLVLEGHDLQRGWHAFLWDVGKTKQAYFHRHLIRDSLLTNWKKICKKHYLKIPIWLSTMEAMVHPNNLDITKTTKYKDLLDPLGKLRTRQDLQEQGFKIDQWLYIQIHSRYKQDIKEFGIYSKLQHLDKILLGSNKKNISKFYKYLLEVELEQEIVKGNMIMWSRNIGRSITLTEWEKIWNRIIKITKSVAYKENMYKMLYRWHLSPSRLAKMNTNSSPKCWKCKNIEGTYFHMWWTCKEAQKYWQKIRKWLEEITKEQIEYKPEFFLLGISDKHFPKKTKYIIIHILTAARLAFAQCWKSSCLPTDQLVIQKICDCAEMDNLTIALKNKESSAFDNNWNAWYNWSSIIFKKVYYVFQGIWAEGILVQLN